MLVPLRVNPDVIWFALAAGAVLAVGSLARWWALRRAPANTAHRWLGSMWSWWLVTAAVVIAAYFDRLGVALLMMTVSWLAFDEFQRLVAVPHAGWYVRLVHWVWIPLHYLLATVSGDPRLIVCLTVLWLLAGGTLLVLSREPAGFVQAAGTLFWGTILTVTTLVHVVMLLSPAGLAEPAMGCVGYALFVIVATEGNDIAQALVGRSVGRHPITPVVSPHKTWEGFLGGLVVTTLGAVPLAAMLLPDGTTVATAMALGAILAVAGFLGDIHMSALKRDLGVKDSGQLFPGQGGMLDRVDSLTFNAPLFYYLAAWVFHD